MSAIEPDFVGPDAHTPSDPSLPPSEDNSFPDDNQPHEDTTGDAPSGSPAASPLVAGCGRKAAPIAAGRRRTN